MIKLLFRYCISNKSNHKHPHKHCVLLLISDQETFPLQLCYTQFGPFVAHEVSSAIRDFLKHLKIRLRNLNSKSNHILNQCICLKQEPQAIQVTGWIISLWVSYCYQSKGAQGIFPCCCQWCLISTNKPGISSLTFVAVMSERPHRTLPRVLWIHATTVAPKTSLLCVGSTIFLLPRLLGMLSGCKDMESHPLTSKSLIRALKKGAEVL